MTLISYTKINDGETIDAADVNTPLDIIYDDYNGNIDSNNLKNSAVTNAKLADGAVTNAKLNTTTGEIGGKWKNWTPIFGNLSGGTLAYAKYMQIGKTVFFKLSYTLTSTNVSGSVNFSLPVTGVTTDADLAIGFAKLWQAGSASLHGSVRRSSSGTSANIFANVISSGNYFADEALSETKPFTWKATDRILAFGTYEAA